jgi:hypothetical protein
MKIRILPRLICIAAFAFVFSFVTISCKKEEKVGIKKEFSSIAEIRSWWENHKKEVSNNNNSAAITGSVAQPVSLSANNGAKDGATFWSGQFENGTPQWNQARTFQIGGATIYEVPFVFPGDMQMFEDYISPSDYPGIVPLPSLYRPTSKTNLLIKQQAGLPNEAEFMSTVITWDYMAALDNSGRGFPVIHIDNVYPSLSGLGDFTGSIKFYDVKGNQRLEEKYGEGALVQYLEYGEIASAFLMNPAPNILPILSVTTYCTTTYVSVTETGPDGNPIVYGYSYLNCWFIESGGSGIGSGGGTGGGGDPRRGGGGGATYTPPPAPTINPINKPLGPCPQNFTFVAVSTNNLWQEAALTNIYSDILMKSRLENDVKLQHLTIDLLYFGLPKYNSEGKLLYTDREAADLASRALDKAEDNTHEHYRKNPNTSAFDLRNFWLREIKGLFQNLTNGKGLVNTAGSINPTNVVPKRQYDPSLCKPKQ